MSNKISAEPVFWKILTCFFEHLLDSNFPVALTTHWGHTHVHYRPVYIGQLQWDKPLESTNEKSQNIHAQTVKSRNFNNFNLCKANSSCSSWIICKQSLWRGTSLLCVCITLNISYLELEQGLFKNFKISDDSKYRG